MDDDAAVGAHPRLLHPFPLLPQRGVLPTEHLLALEEDAAGQPGAGKVEVGGAGAAAAPHGGAVTLATVAPLQGETANKAGKHPTIHKSTTSTSIVIFFSYTDLYLLY